MSDHISEWLGHVGAAARPATEVFAITAVEREAVSAALFSPPEMRRFVALHRYTAHWVCPAFGEQPGDLQAPDGRNDREIVFLLWERTDGRFGVLLPVVDGDLRTVIIGAPGGLRLRFTGRPSHERSLALVTGVGSDPYAAITDTVARAASELATFRLRGEKSLPAFVDYLGWCTWDAFYREVDAQKVIRGLESFRAGGVEPRFVILDDGWQDVRDDRLVSIRARADRFPDGLHGLIVRCKAEFGVDIFGVWHTLMGYWRGIHPDGEIASAYRLERGSTPTGPDQAQPTYLIHPDDVYRYYQDFYARLRSEGVGMTKVDDQNGLAAIDDSATVATMRCYQRAMQGAGGTHLAGNVLHGMCHNNDVAYHMAGSVVWRNSDDYFPRERDSHGFHVHTNAFNALWSSTFGLPDWDMFWTAHEAGPFHAAARAVSGGPIYVSDPPGHHDFDLLWKLVTSDGRVLRCPEPALPTRDCLFVDATREPRPLKVASRNGGIGIVGAFNCYSTTRGAHAGHAVRGTVSAADLRGVSSDRFAVYRYGQEGIAMMTPAETIEIELPPLGFEVLTFSPIDRGAAPLGLLDKFNGSAAIQAAEWLSDSLYRVCLRDGGRIGTYVHRRPASVMNGDRPEAFTYDTATGLLVVSTTPGRPVDLRLHLR